MEALVVVGREGKGTACSVWMKWQCYGCICGALILCALVWPAVARQQIFELLVA